MPIISSWAAARGACSHSDGKSALLYPTSASNTSVELMETRAPVLVIEKSLVQDSGGAGRHRGGLGVRTQLRKLHDDGLPTLFSVYPEGVGIRNEGLFGGQAGGPVLGVVRDLAGTVVQDCGTGELVSINRVDRVVEVQLAGGSGYGDPRQRARRDVDRDVDNGYVTSDAATKAYGGQESAA